MKFIYACIVCLLLSISSQAQQIEESSFGDFTEQELNMKRCNYDTLADAAVLSDYGSSVFEYRTDKYIVVFKRHKRIKILEESGIHNGEVEIPYYDPQKSGKSEKVKHLKAYTYLIKEGKVTDKIKLDKKTVFTERKSANISSKKFVFPGVKKGAILEVSYTIESPYFFTLPEWRYQDRIPTLYSQYKVSLVPRFQYVTINQAIDHFDYEDERSINGSSIHRAILQTYVLKDVPAFKDESYISSINDYLMKSKFQLSHVNLPDNTQKEIITTWSKLNKELKDHDLFGKFVEKCSKYAKDVITELDLDGLTDMQKAERVIDYVKTSFVWNGNYGNFATQSPKKFWKSKTGNDADINLFLTSLLREAGLNAMPVLISTRSHGKIEPLYPFESSFNYVLPIVYGDVPIIVDGTIESLSYDLIPPQCVNGLGLVTDEEEPNWINISYSATSNSKTLYYMTIDPEKDENAIYYINTSDSYLSYNMKNRFENDSTKIKEGYSDLFENITHIKTKNYNNPKAKYTFSFKAKNALERVNDYIVIKPFLGNGLSENYLTQEERKYPVDMIYPRKNTFYCSITIPEGYKINKVPTDLVINDETIVISAKYQITNDKLILDCVYQYKKSVYESDQYKLLKSNVDILVEMLNREVVLEPIE